MFFRMNVFSLFIITLLIEIYLLIQVGSAIGGLETLVLIILSATFGIRILRKPNFISIQKIVEQVKQEQQTGAVQKPVALSEPIIESFLVLGGGFLLIMPGFLSDFVGLIAIFPFSRMFLVRRLSKYFDISPAAANDSYIEAKYHHEDK